MLIGKDFDKIQFDFLGYHLVEPNAFIGDTLILIVSLFFAYKVSKLDRATPFFKAWKWFYIVFGVGFFMGGLGHLCFEYWGIKGKYFSWYSGIVSTYFVEFAMLSIFPILRIQKTLKIVSLAKMIIAFIVATAVFLYVDLNQDPQKGLLVPTLNSVIGLSFSLGYLGWYYSRKIDPSFKFLWISALILIPSAIVQGMKINIHPWMDRNDISHIFLILGLVLYYQTIKGYKKSING